MCCDVFQVLPATAEAPVVVVGDTHGQLHDVCAMYVACTPQHLLYMKTMQADEAYDSNLVMQVAAGWTPFRKTAVHLQW